MVDWYTVMLLIGQIEVLTVGDFLCLQLRSAILREAPFENLSSLEVIDCRYPYEYDGGHIRTAINCHTQEELREKFAFKENDEDFGKKKAIVFHCEFSSKRAPEM